MFYNAKNGCLTIGKTTMDYLVFGKGKNPFIMIPGLGDGLKTAKGMAVPFAIMYKMFAKDYRVYVFSRKNKLEPGYTTKDMAADLRQAMDMLGIPKADILGVSQGGMIAQQFAINYPEAVGKLVLAVTSARPNVYIEKVLPPWIDMAKRDAFHELMVDNMLKMYTDEYIRKNKWMLKVAGKFGKPKTYDRFLIMAEACINHDCFDMLHTIQAPTLVMGGEKDIIVGPESSGEIASQIPGAKLKMYSEYGHALYEEAKDFSDVVFKFLRE